MKAETRQCQNCKSQFTIEPGDFLFYEKIRVPPPTWCPECRMIRRFLLRNELNLYRVKDAVTGKEIFSSFPEEAGLTVYEHDYWWSDKWDPMKYGREYDFSRPFFEQLYDFMKTVPVPSRNIHQLINSDYSNNAGELKNCYLCFNLGGSEDCAYVIAGYSAKNTFDVTEVTGAELCYECFEIGDCYKTFYSVCCDDCHDVWFSRELTGCSHCFGCVNLRNKQYYIFNNPHTKESYFEELKKLNLDSYEGIRRTKERAETFWNKFPYRFMHGTHNVNVSGDFVHWSKNVLHSYNIEGGENLKYCQDLGDTKGGVKDSYDFHNWGDSCELMYESRGSGYGCKSVKFCIDCWPANQDLEYCVRCGSSANLFGCVSLKKKSYCIFNKQYTSDQYYGLRERIIQHMSKMPYTDRRGRVYRYGEFFPPEFSPFGYNETVAQDFFPLTREEADRRGYNWYEPKTREYAATLRVKELPDSIDDASDSILREIIECVSCKRSYRIIAGEFAFLKEHSLPLPRLCPSCRHRRRLSFRNPPKFYRRKCTCGGRASDDGVYQNISEHTHGKNHCPNEFETSYAPERTEIVYCEACYQGEVQ